MDADSSGSATVSGDCGASGSSFAAGWSAPAFELGGDEPFREGDLGAGGFAADFTGGSFGGSGFASALFFVSGPFASPGGVPPSGSCGLDGAAGVLDVAAPGASGFDPGAIGARWLDGAAGIAGGGFACDAGIARSVDRPFGSEPNGATAGAFLLASAEPAGPSPAPRLEPGAPEAPSTALFAGVSTRTAGIRDVESIRVEGTAPASSASE